MSVTTILIIAGIAIVIVALLARRSGPRVTHVDRTVRREKDVDDA